MIKKKKKCKTRENVKITCYYSNDEITKLFAASVVAKTVMMKIIIIIK